MRRADFFVGTSSDLDVEHFAKVFFLSMGITNANSRESSNYVGESYFRCLLGEVEIIVAYSDEQSREEYAFWVAIVGSPSSLESGSVEAVRDQAFQQLVRRGWKVLYVEQWGKRDQSFVAIGT